MLLSGVLGGGVFAAAALAIRIRNRKDVVAFTPFLVLGAMTALALGNGYLVR
jgi:prepilin signal peptidase PulO-like enzyme (type II secretory pathway)